MQVPHLPLPHQNELLWTQIQAILSPPISSTHRLQRILNELSNCVNERPRFEIFFGFLASFSNSDREHFLSSTLPFLQKLVFSLPTLFPTRIHHLTHLNSNQSVEFTREQVFSSSLSNHVRCTTVQLFS
eukprot:TRINITY_DN9953_c0_g1_i1.p1 TRINITY_DN9953_c0_g1~~TRINITY_DN9953_c0_g1_i1.p1  ORF type:complete len:129 (-),score=0.74 TRINITY_DN9953_c0_g1_i1:91-477(-)